MPVGQLHLLSATRADCCQKFYKKKDTESSLPIPIDLATLFHFPGSADRWRAGGAKPAVFVEFAICGRMPDFDASDARSADSKRKVSSGRNFPTTNLLLRL
jgi:hypothetical protein